MIINNPQNNSQRLILRIAGEIRNNMKGYYFLASPTAIRMNHPGGPVSGLMS